MANMYDSINTSFSLGTPFSAADFEKGIKAGSSLNLSQSILGGGGAAQGGMGPFTLAAAGISGIASIFGGINSSRAARDAAYTQAQASKYAADVSRQAGIDVAKANLAQTMFGANFQSEEKDFDRFRQRKVALDKFGPIADARRDSDRRDMLSTFGFNERGDVRAARQRANRERMKQSVVERTAAMRGMFGPIAPISVRGMVI